MKHTLLIILCCLFAKTASAQLKLHSTGQVSIVTTDMPANNAKLTVGDTTSIASGENVNLHSVINLGTTSETNISVNGIVLGTSGTERSIGVRGHARGGNYGLNFGVLGNLHSLDYGVAVFGGVDCPKGVVVSGKYAGYFCGDVKVTNSLTAQNIYNLSDMRLKDNVTYLNKSTESKMSTIDRLKELNVLSYNLKNPLCFTDSVTKREPTEIERRDAQKLHYGVSAQELEQIFPDLVNEGQDGFLTVNYIEMVPLLLQSIQELKQQIDEIRNEKDDAVFMSRRASKRINNESTASADPISIPITATLAQNTPNPFTAQTTIRFTLPDNVHNAYIYIFNMSGKMLKQIPIDSSMQSITIQGYELSAGMYIYSLFVNGAEVDTKRMILSK